MNAGFVNIHCFCDLPHPPFPTIGLVFVHYLSCSSQPVLQAQGLWRLDAIFPYFIPDLVENWNRYSPTRKFIVLLYILQNLNVTIHFILNLAKTLLPAHFTWLHLDETRRSLELIFPSSCYVSATPGTKLFIGYHQVGSDYTRVI